MIFAWRDSIIYLSQFLYEYSLGGIGVSLID
jgi:hypothetical protein